MRNGMNLLAIVASAVLATMMTGTTEDPPILQAPMPTVSQADDPTLADLLGEDMGRLRRHLANAVYARLLVMAGNDGDALITDGLIVRFLHGDGEDWVDFRTAFGQFCQQIAIQHGDYADYTLHFILNTEEDDDGTVLSDICDQICENVADHLVAMRGATVADIRRRVTRITRNEFAEASGGWICVDCSRGTGGGSSGRRCWYDPVSGQLEDKTVTTPSPDDEPRDAEPSPEAGS